VLQLYGVFFQPEGLEFKNFRENLRAFDNPSRWLLLLPVFFLFRNYVVNWKYVAVGIAVGSINAAILAHYQIKVLGVERAYGVFGNPILFAELMVVSDLLLWMLMTYAWSLKQKTLSIFLLFASLMGFYASLLAVSRGAWLAYIAAAIIWVTFNLINGISNPKKIFSKHMIIRAVLMAVVFLYISQTNQYETIKIRTSDLVENVASGNFVRAAEGRSDVFRLSLKIIKEYPFGVGTNNFLAANKKYNDLKGHTAYRNQAHNEILNLWVENGIQAVFCLLLLLGFTLRFFWKNLKNNNELIRIYSTCGLILIISYGIFGITQATFTHQSSLIFFIFFLYYFFAQIQIIDK